MHLFYALTLFKGKYCQLCYATETNIRNIDKFYWDCSYDVAVD